MRPTVARPFSTIHTPGTHPDFKNAIFVLGLRGNGITFSVQGMDLVLKVLAGYADNLLHYYRFDR